jgi:hypothetical protein
MNPLRRKFFKGFGVLGAVVAGATAVKVTVEELKKPAEDHSHLAPEPNTTLTLMGDNRSIKEKQTTIPSPNPNSMYVLQPNPQVTNQVALAVGKDNRLWIKMEDKWHRVSIDS